MKKAFLPLISLMLYLAVGISCSRNHGNASKPKDTPPPNVDVLIASPTRFASDVEVNGTVLSDEMIELHPESSGRITYLYMPDGATVQKGTLWAKINDADLQAQMQQQKVQLELAEKTEQRLRSLLSVNGVNQSDYDAALSQVNLIKANIQVLDAQIDKTLVKAAFSGRLGLRQVSNGAYVTPATVIGTLQQYDQVKVDFSIPETYLPMVSKGMAVCISGSGVENAPATVIAIEPQISTSSRNIKIRAKLPANPHIAPGAFVKVVLGQEKTGILVPGNAIIPDALSSQVIVVEEGKAKLRNVVTGRRNADQVEVLKGIETGDSVVVSGVLFARPGKSVKVRKVTTADNNMPL